MCTFLIVFFLYQRKVWMCLKIRFGGGILVQTNTPFFFVRYVSPSEAHSLRCACTRGMFHLSLSKFYVFFYETIFFLLVTHRKTVLPHPPLEK